MSIVGFALRFPHAFYVAAALIPSLGISAIAVMPTDIFPQINTPVVSVREALIFNRYGQRVAVVRDGKAEIRNVRVMRDLGTREDVDAGLNAGERVILHSPVTLVVGGNVQPRLRPAGPAT